MVEIPKYRSLLFLDAMDKESGGLNVIIETPKGSRNKFKYTPALDIFKLDSTLQAGASFPFDFGFIPSTLGEDGDPLDILVLMDQSVYTGCLVPARLIGVIEAKQMEKKGKFERNDRLIGVFAKSHAYNDIKSLQQLNKNVLEEIQFFFETYNRYKGREFKPLGQYGPKQAMKLVRQGIKTFNEKYI
ncbi:MAG: inorganic diphosphatase [Ignavibacteria bacterium]|jgi:inorganic pyrophosphatase|nr:inorganic diphosphatase [Ignavibacteria bacterium]MCU7503901.1 inorganic diphosphatase [Ignavibacteria bacterium]MCU7515878.1 inorganic diphosphatase [Ignavibacteria bacterium]